MPNTIEQLMQFQLDHPRRDNGKRWADASGSWCEAFIHQGGGFAQTFATATAAGSASGPLAPDKTVIVGHLYYFSGGADNAGHIMAGTPRGLLSASTANRTDSGTGYLPSVDAYLARKPFMKYRGHTARHGSQTFAPSAATAGTGGTRPINQEEPMEGIRVMDAPQLGVVALFNGTVYWQELSTDPSKGSPLMAQVANALRPQAEPYNAAIWAARSPAASGFNAGITALRHKVLDFDNATGTVYDLTQPAAAAAMDPMTLARALAPLLPASAGITQAQAEAAAEHAIRNVLGALKP